MKSRSLVRHALLGATALALPVGGITVAGTTALVGEPSKTSERPVDVHVPSGAPVPLRFEANVGQLAGSARFVARGRGLTALFADEGPTFVLEANGSRRRLAMRVVGRTGTSPPVADEPLVTRSNYFLGNDPARWQTNVPNFGRVTYRNVIAGVDQVFHGQGGALEYDLVVAPGSRPEALEIALDGVDSLALDERGDLAITVGQTVVVETKPKVYQHKDGQELAITAAYRLTGPWSVAFDVGDYDRTSALVIDPVLAYATYLGGSGNDYAYGIAVDASGATYVAGSTTSANFPTEAGVDDAFSGTEDVFVAKLTPTGDALVYATYLGGSQGAYGYGLAVDTSGSAYVVGVTSSSDFPTTGAYEGTLAGNLDAFVTKLSPAGSALAYSTYLGGSGNDYGYGIAVDASDAAYVVGTTESTDFPNLLGPQGAFGGGSSDAFLAKLTPSGSTLSYATYLGGAQTEVGTGIAVDGAGAAYVTGFTTSLDFPVAPTLPFQALNAGNQSAFVTKVSPGGAALAYSTYLGGSQSDRGNSIAVDDAGAAYVTGSATSPDFPTVHAYQSASIAPDGSSSAFVTKVAPTGTALVYSTFLGGSGGDVGTAIAVDGAGEAYVTGVTSSTDFPTLTPFQATLAANPVNGGTNAFVARLSTAGSALLYSSYLGGSVGDTAQSIAVGPDQSAFLTGFTASPDFPTVAPLDAHLTSQTGANAFVAVVANRPFEGDAAAPPSDESTDAALDGSSSRSFAADATEPDVDASTSSPFEGVDVAGGGCSCHAAESPGAPPGEWLLLATGAVVRIGRRTRRQRGVAPLAAPSRFAAGSQTTLAPTRIAQN